MAAASALATFCKASFNVLEDEILGGVVINELIRVFNTSWFISESIEARSAMIPVIAMFILGGLDFVDHEITSPENIKKSS
jgi:hypothetical protein